MNTDIGKLPPWLVLFISFIFTVEMFDAAEKSAHYLTARKHLHT